MTASGHTSPLAVCSRVGALIRVGGGGKADVRGVVTGERCRSTVALAATSRDGPSRPKRVYQGRGRAGRGKIEQERY